jgi:hypothetical protein
MSFAFWFRRRKEQNIALALMIALLMVMVHILVEYMPQGAFAKQNHPGQRFVFDRWDPTLRVGIQVGRLGWQDYALDAGIIDDLLKRGTELGVAVMDEILAG